MGNEKHKIIFFLRYVILLLIIIHSITSVNDIDYRHFIFFLLLFIFNMQMRTSILKNKLLIVSTFADLLLIYYINSHYCNVFYILVFITLLDTLFIIPKEAPVVSLIIAFFLAYLLKDKSLEIILLNTFIYFLSIAYICKLKKLEDNLIHTRTLYDWNRLHAYELENAKKDLENHTKVIEYVSQMEERNRISREIHDTIGHKLTGTLMQLEASLRVLNKDYGRGKDMLHSVSNNLSNCVDLLRQTVRDIKPKEYTSRIILIRQMLDDFSKETGVSINFNITGSVLRIYPSIEMLIYKNIQEGVTNSVRHGKASCIDIELTYLSNHIILTIEDNGTFKKDFVKGMGISGMEERAKLFGGKVVISTEDRFTVKTVVPISVDMKTN